MKKCLELNQPIIVIEDDINIKDNAIALQDQNIDFWKQPKIQSPQHQISKLVHLKLIHD